ncbi:MULTISPECIES: hypothetical protein [Corynebacterium]|uniref:Lipoprotein LpqE n=1 Tax=Corynebacterium provencense TaxID=1737425 RepID=A0A2Z3YWP8_9CORY|nr:MULTISPECIES: hypothetical protein [Corynebacterium]AWT26984.1 Putative lipoprotein LpqE [Corynebacterium provencense]MCI1255160.1 hypothetical protein [Corynebacterium provencense]
MKHLKSPGARGALALVAGSAALALTACGAGQISQTANQVPAVNGTNGESGDAVVRDVSLIIQEDRSVALKFNASNQAIDKDPVVLSSVKIEDATFNLGGNRTIDPRCNLVADSEQGLKDMRAQDNTSSCTEYLPTTVEGTDFYPGASRNITFSFDTGDIQINAPITSYYAPSGTLHRDQDGVTKEGSELADLPASH